MKKWIFIALCTCVLGYPVLAQTIQSTGCSGNCTMNNLILGVTGILGFGSDTGLSRNSAGIVNVGNGTFGDASGTVNARSVLISGSSPATSGSCSFGSLAGGNTVGTFVAQGCGPPATAATAMILTFALTAPTGWSCDASDRTSNVAVGATVQALTQNFSTSTLAGFRASTLTGDVIQFKCIAY